MADNCSDETAERARQSGARVLERSDPERRGKGFALDYAFRNLLAEAPDAFAVVDADSEVASNFLVETAAVLSAGADAVQCRYLVRSSVTSFRTRLVGLASAGFNIVRPRGRARWGLSAGLYGNGFALSTETVRAVPYGASSVVEDVEYHLSLVRAGRRVQFADRTFVLADLPTSNAGAESQRARWEGGRLRMLLTKAPTLVQRILSGEFALTEPLFDLLLLPLAFHVVLLLVTAFTPFARVRDVALAGLATVTFHLVAAVWVTGGRARDLAALLGAPFYILWKLLLLSQIVRGAALRAAWVRTERAGERRL